MTSLYNQEDLENFQDNKEIIENEVKEAQSKLLEPSLEDMNKVNEIIFEYVREKGRKIYGGLAQDYSIKIANTQDGIYNDPYEPADIDFYSPEPLQDIKNLADKIYKEGFKPIEGKDAVHKNTYSLFVNHQPQCDITYTPKNIYNRMPFKAYYDDKKKEKGLNIIHPHFSMVDVFKMMNDLVNSFWRIEKGFSRMIKLLEYYPFPKKDQPIDIKEAGGNIKNALDVILEYLKNNDRCIIVGFYAYNHFVRRSKINTVNKNIKLFQPPYYDIITTNYREDSMNLINKLKEKMDEYSPDSVSYQEHYPFFQFTGDTVRIYVDKELVAVVHSNNNMCLPYREKTAYSFKSNTIKNQKITEKIPREETVKIGTWSLTILHVLISLFYHRTQKNMDLVDMNYTILYHLTQARNYFFKRTGYTNIHDTLFKDFVVSCIGKPINPAKEKREKNEAKKKAGKRFGFKYDPENPPSELPNYTFENSSGNPIPDKNEKHKKLFKDPSNINTVNMEEGPVSPSIDTDDLSDMEKDEKSKN